MHDSLKNHFLAVGLGDHEAAVLAVLASDSPASAAHIANRCRLSRSTVYTALDRLIAKGLVGTTYRNEVKQFVAQPPSAVDEYLKHEEEAVRSRRTAFDALAAQLAIIGRNDAAVPNIIFFEGKDGLKKIYLDMLRGAPKDATMYIVRDEFMLDKEWSFVFSREWNEKVRRLRMEKNIRTKLLINDSPKEHAYLDYYLRRPHTQFRFLPPEHAVRDFVVYILGDVVSILSTQHGAMVGIKIANRAIAANFAAIFAALWSGSRPTTASRNKKTAHVQSGRTSTKRGPR